MKFKSVQLNVNVTNIRSIFFFTPEKCQNVKYLTVLISTTSKSCVHTKCYGVSDSIIFNFIEGL